MIKAKSAFQFRFGISFLLLLIFVAALVSIRLREEFLAPNWRPYSPAVAREAIECGHPTFIVVTVDWDPTGQVFYESILKHWRIKRAFYKSNAKLFIVDASDSQDADKEFPELLAGEDHVVGAPSLIGVAPTQPESYERSHSFLIGDIEKFIRRIATKKQHD